MLHIQTYYTKKLDSKELSMAQVMEVLASEYNEQRGYGFLSLTMSDYVISARLLYDSISSQIVFNNEDGTLDLQPQKIFQQIPFKLDVEKGLLLSSTGGQRFGKLLFTLSQVFNYKIAIEDVSINLSNLLLKLEEESKSFQITGLVIQNYHPHVGITGLFSALVDNTLDALNLVNNYETDVIEIAFTAFEYPEEVKYKVSSKGKFSIKTEAYFLDQKVNEFVDIILECQNA